MGRKQRPPKHRHGLADQIEDPQSQGVRTHPRAEKKRRRAEEEGDELVSAKLSGRILKAAREQQEEIDAEEAEDEQHLISGKISAGVLADALKRAADSDDDGDVSDDDLPGFTLRRATAAAQKGGKAAEASDDFDYPDVAGDDEDISPEDEQALAAFMAPEAGGHRQLSLGDLVLSKIREKQREQGLQEVPLRADGSDDEEEAGPSAVPDGMDDKVIEVYRGVGRLLSRYTTGKVPKAFKIIPSLKNWEDVLYLTEPDSWSVHAVYQATRLFVSNLNARLAQRFLALVLLPRVRREIRQKQKLHFALFQALKKATYKPGAFYKGLLLPLCQSRTCSLREAVIFSSVLKRVSIPVLHSAAALLRMAEMEYCGTTSFFVRVLLDKKYALPYRVVDALVDHFVRFADDERTLPVVWHQCLLCFVQRYKEEIREGDKAALRALCQSQHHYQVTPEVLRELDHSGSRDGGPKPRATGAAAMEVQSHVGVHVVEDVRNLPPVIMED